MPVLSSGTLSFRSVILKLDPVREVLFSRHLLEIMLLMVFLDSRLRNLGLDHS